MSQFFHSSISLKFSNFATRRLNNSEERSFKISRGKKNSFGSFSFDDDDDEEEEEERRKILERRNFFNRRLPGAPGNSRAEKGAAAVCLLGRLGSARNKEVGRERRIRSDSRRVNHVGGFLSAADEKHGGNEIRGKRWKRKQRERERKKTKKKKKKRKEEKKKKKKKKRENER